MGVGVEKAAGQRRCVQVCGNYPLSLTSMQPLVSLATLTLSVRPITTAAEAQATCWISSPTSQPARLTLLTAMGQLVSTRCVALATGEQTFPLALHGLAVGTYLLRLQAAEDIVSKMLSII